MRHRERKHLMLAVAAAAAIIAIGLWSWNTLATLFHRPAAVALFGILNFVFCPFEEKRLRAAFPGFDAYAAGVRRCI